MSFNLKPILNGTQVALEKQAQSVFGAAVEDFAKGQLGSVFGLPSSSDAPVNRNDGSYYATSYAAALAGATSYRPKLKFLFKVEFVFNEEAKKAFPAIFGSATANDFTFMIKSVDRPKVDFDWEDDVNMYNFRTKVLKKIHHRELTMTLMDDTGNRVFNFFRALMMLYQPITRRQLTRDGSTAPPTPSSAQYGSGMAFSGLSNSSMDTAHRAAIQSAFGNAIDCIRVKQIFVDPSQKLNNAVREVIFDFLNARMVSFDFDDLTHETSDVSLLTLQFDYDWMEMVDVGALAKVDQPQTITSPGINGAPSDYSVPGNPDTSGGSSNPFVDILTNHATKGLQSLASTAISKAVNGIAGKNRFAKMLGSAAAEPLRSLTNAVIRDRAGGIVAPSRPVESILYDTATGENGKPIAIVQNRT
jgi:hypothetical protein